MPDRRQKNANWAVASATGEIYPSVADGVFVALLLDIRDELQAINRVLGCYNTLRIPQVLDAIRRNTTKPRKTWKPRKTRTPRRATTGVSGS